MDEYRGTLRLISLILILNTFLVTCSNQHKTRSDIVRYEMQDSDRYAYGYATNGNKAEKQNKENQPKSEKNSVVAIEGNISWLSSNGQKFSLNYVADDKGFLPDSIHLQTL